MTIHRRDLYGMDVQAVYLDEVCVYQSIDAGDVTADTLEWLLPEFTASWGGELPDDARLVYSHRHPVPHWALPDGVLPDGTAYVYEIH